MQTVAPRDAVAPSPSFGAHGRMRWLTLILMTLLAACSPPGILNGLDLVTPGGGGSRAAAGIGFGAHGQALYVWQPGRTAKPAPVVVFYYGGGWVKGARGDYGFAARAYAARGFVVVVPDYRKVPTVRFPAFVEDAADAVAWTHANVAKYGGDPHRIALVGHSAGAYAVAMLALDPRFMQRTGVDHRVIRAGVGLAGPYHFYPYTGRAIDALSTAPSAETQPIRLARAGAPPLLLATGTEDTTVRPRNARNLAARLRELRTPVELREYAGLGHEDIVMALSRPFRGKGAVLDDSVRFLQTAMPAAEGAP